MLQCGLRTVLEIVLSEEGISREKFGLLERVRAVNEDAKFRDLLKREDYVEVHMEFAGDEGKTDEESHIEYYQAKHPISMSFSDAKQAEEWQANLRSEWRATRGAPDGEQDVLLSSKSRMDEVAVELKSQFNDLKDKLDLLGEAVDDEDDSFSQNAQPQSLRNRFSRRAQAQESEQEKSIALIDDMINGNNNNNNNNNNNMEEDVKDDYFDQICGDLDAEWNDFEFNAEDIAMIDKIQ